MEQAPKKHRTAVDPAPGVIAIVPSAEPEAPAPEVDPGERWARAHGLSFLGFEPNMVPSPEVMAGPELADLRAALGELVGRTAQHHQARAHLQQLEKTGRREAEKADTAALAAALKAGEPDPGAKAVEKFERDVLDARRRAGALEQLVREATAALAAVADQRRAAWAAAVGQRIDAARAAFAAAIGALEQAGGDYAALQGLANFVSELPRAKRYRPALVQVGDRPLAEAIAGLRRTLDGPR